jgi:uncharacterized damage-inducible protein DinB
MSSDPVRLDIVPVWARFNEELIRLVDFVPDDKINWSPKPELWNFRGILMHIAATRDNWLKGAVQDGIEAPDVYRTVRTKLEIQEAYRRTWSRLERFLSNPQQLDATYDGDEGPVSGHWIAFHLLEHDIHHRADIFHYLALLGIETPGVGTP